MCALAKSDPKALYEQNEDFIARLDFRIDRVKVGPVVEILHEIRRHAEKIRADLEKIHNYDRMPEEVFVYYAETNKVVRMKKHLLFDLAQDEKFREEILSK